MRRVFNGFGRTLVVVSVLVALAIPAEARTQGGEGKWFTDNPITRVVKIIKKIAVRTFGDGLIDPKP
jgi:hypothetical protein